MKPGHGHLTYRVELDHNEVEEGTGEYVYTGRIDYAGKMTFQPIVTGEQPIYLFDYEVEDWIPLD